MNGADMGIYRRFSLSDPDYLDRYEMLDYDFYSHLEEDKSVRFLSFIARIQSESCPRKLLIWMPGTG